MGPRAVGPVSSGEVKRRHRLMPGRKVTWRCTGRRPSVCREGGWIPPSLTASQGASRARRLLLSGEADPTPPLRQPFLPKLTDRVTQTAKVNGQGEALGDPEGPVGKGGSRSLGGVGAQGRLGKGQLVRGRERDLDCPRVCWLKEELHVPTRRLSRGSCYVRSVSQRKTSAT